MTPRELQAILAWSALPWVGERTLLGLLDHAREARGTLADLWESPLADLHAVVPLHPKSRAALEEDAPEYWRRAGADAATIQNWGVDVLLAGQPEYPAALSDFSRKWPLNFAYGALGLLEGPRVALVNSRTVSNRALAATDALADALARRDVTLVASINKESYIAAATAAKRHAGASIMVLDRGIAEAFPTGIKRDPVAPARVWDEDFDPDLQLLLSPLGWRQRWNRRSSAQRDALVVDLADVVIALDVRSGGNMERECLRAAKDGKPVLALEADGIANSLVEAGLPALRWTGGEDTANRVIQRLPALPPEDAEEQGRTGWLKEIAVFLARACCHLQREPHAPAAAYPAEGVFAQVAAGWSRGAEEGTGCGWLLADLSESRSPGVAAQLLLRVSPGGLLAAVVPTEWLEAEEHALARERWLRESTLALTVRLPRPPRERGGRSLAAILLRRQGRAEEAVRAFAPEQERMGRFHLRRYLQEVVRAL
jgi:hypothetical protein